MDGESDREKEPKRKARLLAVETNSLFDTFNAGFLEENANLKL